MMFPETKAAWRRFRIAWHKYRLAVHDDKCLHHMVRIDQLRDHLKDKP